ncbi:hypothetical protein BGX38DRAFT_144362 [Terfezia claveryi]|nr:hypothetical protein BGX38DRAFT_144362 [Terfezia claveryi]
MPPNKRLGHVPSEPIWSQALTQPAAADDNHSVFIPAHNSIDNLDHVLPMGNPVYLVNAGYPLAHADRHEFFYAHPQDHFGFDRRTSETVIPLPAASKNNGFVMERQRKLKPRQEKKPIICQFLGYDCQFMMAKDHGIFKNFAELKEDALRHLNAFQCEKCGKRFGKRYGKERHSEKKQIPCTPPEGGNNQAVTWITPDFAAAIVELEDAKKEAKVMAAIAKCIQLCGAHCYQCLDGKPRIRNREKPQRRLPLHDNLVAGVTDQPTVTTSPDHSQDLLVNDTVEQPSGYQELGTAICDSIYMNYAPDEMELNQNPQGPHVDTTFYHELLGLTEEEPPGLAQDRFEFIANLDFPNRSGELSSTTTFSRLPKGGNPYYSQHSPTQDPTGWYSSAQHQDASDHDTGELSSTTTFSRMPKGGNPYYSQHPPTQDPTGWYSSAQHQGASDHDTGVEDVVNQNSRPYPVDYGYGSNYVSYDE